ncbi:MAG: alpha/beta hydrolase [Chloroflexi bacterium]|nr:MAG: alpha/beta hydrolase [Chloroflexota bacterium]
MVANMRRTGQQMLVTLGLSLVFIYVVICALLYAVQERLLFYPEVLPPRYTFNFSTRFNEVTLPAEGATLHALHFTVDEPKGVVLYLHGNAGSVRTWGLVASDFVAHNYDVLIPDYRGYGKSTGTLTGERMLQDDAAIMYSYLLQRYPEQQIVVYGRSLGTGLAVALAATHDPKLLILETPYVSLQALATAQFPWVPGFLFKYPFRTDRLIGAVKSPVVLFHGTNDDVIPYAASEQLLPLIRSHHKLVTIEGGGHNNLRDFPAYQHHLAQLFND